MARRIVTGVLLIVCLAVAPPAAHGPATPAPGWDLFAAEAQFVSLAPRAAFAPESAALTAGHRPHATPEPAALLLLSLCLLGLRQRQWVRALSHAAATARGERPPWSTAPFRRRMVGASIAPPSPASARTTSGRSRASRAPASTTAS